MTLRRIALPILALATAMSGLALASAAEARGNGASSGRAFVIVTPAQKPTSSKPSAPKPPQRWPMANSKPIVVAPPAKPLVGRPLPYKPPVVVAPPSSGPLAGKPYRPYRPYKPVVDASNAPGGVVVTTRPTPPPKPVTCIGPLC